MIPDAGEVVRRRWTVQTVLRLSSILLLFGASRPLLSWVSEGLRDGDLWDMSYYMDRVALVVITVVIAAVVFVMSGLLSRWLVPVRRFVQCPGCRHRIEGMLEPRCTECGLVLTREFIEHQPLAARERAQRPRRVLRHRETLAVIFRISGIFAALLGLIWGAGSVIATVNWYITGEVDSYYGFADLIGAFLQTVIWLAFAGMMLFKPKWLARFCAPYRAGDADP